MKKTNFSLQKTVLLLAMIMLTVIPNMKVYSFVGGYASSSSALTANSTLPTKLQASETAAWWVAAIAVAVGAVVLAYDTGYVVGTLAHHAYNAFGEQQQSIAMIAGNYNSTDFSKFDN